MIHDFIRYVIYTFELYMDLYNYNYREAYAYIMHDICIYLHELQANGEIRDNINITRVAEQLIGIISNRNDTNLRIYIKSLLPKYEIINVLPRNKLIAEGFNIR